jgi:hypothetical protein
MQMISQGRKAKQRKKQKICHGLTRNYTEKTEAEEATEGRISRRLATEKHGRKNKQKVEQKGSGLFFST